MHIGRIHTSPSWKFWKKGWLWIEPQDNPLYSDMYDEMPFWAVRAGSNRVQRVTKMLEMGFVSNNEARALLGIT